jgi:hypothetical protein
MNGFLVFIDAADDAACYPLSRFRGMTVAADATILMQFDSSVNGTADGDADLVTLTCTADKEREVFLAIAKQVQKGGVVLVADDVASEYCHSAITACAITLESI